MSRASAVEIAVIAGAGALCGAAIATLVAKRGERGGDARQEGEERAATGIAGLEDRAGEDELREEQLSRNVLFFGEDGQRAIDRAFVVVVGLGGVGSHAAQMLIRAGVGRVRLVDFDQVTLSSLNRHAVATREDVGRPKVEAMRRHMLRVAPWCRIDARAQMFTAEAAASLLEGAPDYVLDCIDDVPTKVALLAACRRAGVPVLASMGAGAKADPTRLHIGTVADAIADKLALKIKALLRQEGVRAGDVPAVYSSEVATRKLAALSSEQADDPAAFGAVPNFRLRVLPVLGTTPAVFGQAMAAKVLTDVAGCPLEPEESPRLPSKRRTRHLNALKAHEKRAHGINHVPMDVEDMDFVVRVVWRLRSAIRPHEAPDAGALELVRWDVARPPAVDNVVLVAKKEVPLMAPREDGRDPRDFLDPAVRKRIQDRINETAAE